MTENTSFMPGDWVVVASESTNTRFSDNSRVPLNSIFQVTTVATLEFTEKTRFVEGKGPGPDGPETVLWASTDNIKHTPATYIIEYCDTVFVVYGEKGLNGCFLDMAVKYGAEQHEITFLCSLPDYKAVQRVNEDKSNGE